VTSYKNRVGTVLGNSQLEETFFDSFLMIAKPSEIFVQVVFIQLLDPENLARA